MSDKTKIFIYCLIDPEDDRIVYVGRTRDVAKRMNKHNNPQKNVTSFKHEYIRSLKSRGLTVRHEVLDIVEVDEAPFWERFYTDLFKSWGLDLLNNRYYKFGNQTSFKVGERYRPIIALNRDGSVFAEYPSFIAARTSFGKAGISNAIAKRKKTAGDKIWFYKESYESSSKEEIYRIIKWANTSDVGKPNRGCFKKGRVSERKVYVPEEIEQQIRQDYQQNKPSERKLAAKYGLSKGVIRRIVKNPNNPNT